MLRSPSLTLVPAILLAACSPAASAAPPATAPQSLLRTPRWLEKLAAPLAKPASSGTTAARDVETIGTEPESDTPPVKRTAWTDLLAGTKAKPASTEGAAPVTGDGTTLKRWLSDRLPALSKPAPLVPAEGDEPPAVERTDSDQTVATTDGESAAVSAPVAANPDEMPTLSIDPASFRGVLPGKTTRAEVAASWGAGEAFTREDGTQGVAWAIDPFERVEVSIDGDTVASIRIKLDEPVAVAELAKQLEIADIRTVPVLDDKGATIGEVYPERGVILSLASGTRNAAAILIEPLDPESFVLRAERSFDASSAAALADLLYAVQIDPRHARAHRLLLAMTSAQGRWTQALALANRAVQLDDADPWTQIKRAGVLIAVDRPEEARVALEAVLAREANSPLVTAQVHRLLGRAALAGAAPRHQAAVEHFAESIRRAAPLVAKKSSATQPAACEVLLDAHLGTAQAIAEGTWQQKGRVIPKWIARAEAIVADFQGTDAERMILELQLCRGALAAAAGSAEATDPTPWVKRLLGLRDRMSEGITDPWRRRQVDWEVGQGLNDALTAAQKRGDAEDMLDNATLTAAYLERGAEHRELTAGERRELGELMFRIGIMYSLQRGDHPTAVTWFDQVLPLWNDNEAVARQADLGRVGESYVSMAISFWQVDRRDEALALNRRGVDFMVAAVDKKQLDERALAVAYGNLSTMYAEQGDESQSRTYAEMASRAEATGTRLR
ncbi:MAG: tetratricopeptide repeat protein [Planctomycetaceae bacterium]